MDEFVKTSRVPLSTMSSDIKQITEVQIDTRLQFSKEGSQVRYKEIEHKRITLQKKQ